MRKDMRINPDARTLQTQGTLTAMKNASEGSPAVHEEVSNTTYWKRRIAVGLSASALILGFDPQVRSNVSEAFASVKDAAHSTVDGIIERDNERFMQNYGPDSTSGGTNLTELNS